MDIVLNNQLEASEKSADQLESELQRQIRGAEVCGEIQDLMKILVALLASLDQHVSKWRERTESGASELRAGIEYSGDYWIERYTRLEGTFLRTQKLINAIEELSFSVDGKREFLIAWKNLRSITCFSSESVREGIAQIKRGEVMPLAEVKRELWDSPIN